MPDYLPEEVVLEILHRFYFLLAEKFDFSTHFQLHVGPVYGSMDPKLIAHVRT